MTRGRDKRGKSEGGAEGELPQATGDSSPSGPVLPTRPPLHLLEPMRSHGEPREQMQILQKPSSPEPGLLPHTQATAGPSARCPHSSQASSRTAGGQRWQLLKVGVQRPESAASPSLSLRGRIWADCRCSGATARSQAAAAPTLRASWLCSQRLRDALQVWWALPSHMPREDEWDGQTLELSLGLLPALPAWPTGVHRGSSPCGSSDGLREGCRFRDPEEQRLGGSRRV